jgi:hypothetical protein
VAVHRHQVVLEAAHQAVVAPAPRRRAVAEAVQVVVLEVEEVWGAGAPEAGLVAVQAVAREATQVVVLEAEADLGQNRITTSSKPSNVPMT